MAGKIIVRGARVHNLKNIDVEIPRDRFVVITGVSGSGKSSLAFDTLYAEGQRRYLESIAADAKRLLQQIEKPDVDSIEGLSPTIAIQQRPGAASPRSTVGTITGVYDFLRLLFARAGQLICANCGREINAHTSEQIVDQILLLPEQTRIVVLSPLRLSSKANLPKLLEELVSQGFTRVMIDDQMVELGRKPQFDLGAAPKLDLVIDRMVLRKDVRKRLAESIEIAGRRTDQVIKIRILPEQDGEPARELAFSQKAVCLNCGAVAPEITPGLFSFNSPQGACPRCDGLGEISQKKGGDRDSELAVCPGCAGTRLKKESRAVHIVGQNIAQVAALPANAVIEFLQRLDFSEERKKIGERVIGEIIPRLRALLELGLGYVSLDRSSVTLSGGELQRVRLASQIGSGMAGVLYLLDEPSMGLHQKDNAQLLDLLKRLRDIGNSIVVVEHDSETIRAADHVIDMGPGAGERGGEVVAQGTPEEILRDCRSLTGRYLSGAVRIPRPSNRRTGHGKFITIKDARARNLKNITVDIPIGAMTCVTGVSGAGKSTLVMEVLYRGLQWQLRHPKLKNPTPAEFVGAEAIERVIGVDQQPIGRTPRSNPATYTSIYDYLREFFAQLPEARMRGYGPERFSFNLKGGRCEACAGDGVTRVEMYFIPDILVTCPVCRGQRYNRETLDIRYKGLSVADILDLTIDHASELLNQIPAIRDRLQTLRDVGLGYVKLGQPAATLSGGEAQRIKLARELGRKSAAHTLYVLDEPTTGLHFDDIKKLLELLGRLTDAANTLVVIEHNLEVIKAADYVIDLGPGSGEDGGHVVVHGAPEQVVDATNSFTARYLKKLLEAPVR